MVPSFDQSLARDVEWIDEALEPFAGSLPQGTQLRIERICVRARSVAVTMWFLPAARSDFQQGYRYWWICNR